MWSMDEDVDTVEHGEGWWRLVDDGGGWFILEGKGIC